MRRVDRWHGSAWAWKSTDSQVRGQATGVSHGQMWGHSEDGVFSVAQASWYRCRCICQCMVLFLGGKQACG